MVQELATKVLCDRKLKKFKFGAALCLLFPFEQNLWRYNYILPLF
jgi:hypothetical protein